MWGLTFTCNADELQPPIATADASFGGNRIPLNPFHHPHHHTRMILIFKEICPTTTGEQVIAGLGMNQHFWWRWIDLAVMAAYSFGFLIIAYLPHVIFANFFLTTIDILC